MTTEEARSIRYGVYQSMHRIRLQLMRAGEWNDPTILPLHSIERRLAKSGASDFKLISRAAHEHTIRWMARQAVPA